jgi:hypothetical protein
MKHLRILLIISIVSGCAPVHWQRGDGLNGADERAQFNVDNATCRLMARGSAQGFVAVGSQAYVTGAAIGNGIGNAINVRETYKDCMGSRGYIEADSGGASTTGEPGSCGWQHPCPPSAPTPAPAAALAPSPPASPPTALTSAVNPAPTPAGAWPNVIPPLSPPPAPAPPQPAAAVSLPPQAPAATSEYSYEQAEQQYRQAEQLYQRQLELQRTQGR